MDVYNLYAKLSLDTDEYERDLGKAKTGLSSFASVFSGTFLGNLISDGIRNVTTGFAEIGKSAANAAFEIGKSSLDSYADYEQLVGGVETLYKDSAGVVQKYAADAYKTVGLSANDYMETATSFAAALVNSLGGDTEKAAEMANVAITDMSDNANKMGTNITSIQDAYNGFAKQNYTMLDNLKLGYGGTKTEMERLVKEAAAMTDAQEKLNISVDDSSLSYSNIVAAIHVVQADMGILGTTSEEAATTIQGSTSSMQGAWENLLTAIADPEQDFQGAVDNLVDSIITAGQNIVPRIQEIVPTLIDGISELVAQLAPYVSSVIMELEPTVEEGIHALFSGLGNVASSLMPIVEDTFSFVGGAIRDSIVNAIQDSDFSFLLDAFDGIRDAAENILPVIENIAPLIVTIGTAAKGWEIGKKLQGMVTGFGEAKVAVSLFSMGLDDAEVVQGALSGTLSKTETVAGLLTGKIDLLSFAQGKLKSAQSALNSVMAANPISLIVVAVGALIGVLAVLYAKNEDFRNAVNNMISGILEKIQAFGEWVQPYIQAVISFIETTVQGIIESVQPVLQSVEEAFSEAFEFIKTIWSGIAPLFSGLMGVIMAAVQTAAGIIGSAFELAWTLVSTVWSVATSFFKTIFDTIAGIFSAVDAVLHGDFSAAWESIKGVLSGWGDFFQGLVDDLFELFAGIGGFFIDVGKEIVQGLKDGISAAWEGLKSFVSGLWDGLKGIFHISADDVSVDGGSVNGSHAGGLDFVPYNNYVANLHRGEMVLTAREAENYRKGENRTGGGVTVIQNIYSQAKTAAELMREAQYQQRRALMMGAI